MLLTHFCLIGRNVLQLFIIIYLGVCTVCMVGAVVVVRTCADVHTSPPSFRAERVHQTNPPPARQELDTVRTSRFDTTSQKSASIPPELRRHISF